MTKLAPTTDKVGAELMTKLAPTTDKVGARIKRNLLNESFQKEPSKEHALPREVDEVDQCGLEGGIGFEGTGDESPNTDIQSLAEFERKLLKAWNSARGTLEVKEFSDQRRRLLRSRLQNTGWCVACWKALAKFPLKCFSGPGSWTPTIDWFLRADTVTKIVERHYDFAKQAGSRRNYSVPQLELGPDDHDAPKDPNYGKW